MLVSQFRRLTDTFWKTGDPSQFERNFANFHKVLASLPEAAVEAAVDAWLDGGKRMPYPAELKELALGNMRPATRVERDGPCQYCQATFREAAATRESTARTYVVHEPKCPTPFGEKPAEYTWVEDFPPIETSEETANERGPLADAVDGVVTAANPERAE